MFDIVLNTAIVYLLAVLGVLGTMAWWHGLYDVEEFNCVDMSYAWAPVFKKLGFNTSIIYGSNNESAHCWIRLGRYDFEATCLWFWDESKYSVDFVDRYPWGYTDEILRFRRMDG